MNQGIVIDTGCLLVLLAFDALRSKRTPPTQLRNRLNSVWGGQPELGLDNFEALWKRFEDADRRWTTPHVYSEVKIHRFSSHLGFDAYKVTEALFALVDHYGISEENVPLSDLTDSSLRLHVSKIGITDVGVLELARRKRCLLMTTDAADFAPLAAEHGIRLSTPTNP